MNRIERFSLLLTAAGTAMVWLVPHFMRGSGLPDWIGSRFYLYVCAPAVLLGCCCFHRYGGYAKSKMALLCGLLMCVGLLWTDSSEQGRGLLEAAGFLVTLPIAALIRKQRYIQQFLAVFAFVTALGMLYGLTQPAALGRWGEIVDSTGTHITNANVVGTQAAAAIIAAFLSFPRHRPWSWILFAATLLVLGAACFLTQTRTGIAALCGAGLVVVAMRLRHKPALLVTGGFISLGLLACLLAADTAIMQGAVYEGVVNRLVRDEEENLGSFGDRTKIWRFAAQEFLEGTTWITGVGTGGADKELGKFYEFSGRFSGRDRIWRLYPHNSLVQNGLAFGIFGLVLTACMGFQVARRAYRLDSSFRGWQRSAFVVFFGLVGTGLVVQREVYWIAVGSALWAMVSTDKPARGRGPLAARLARGGAPASSPSSPCGS
jgi:O-antigen ligase